MVRGFLTRHEPNVQIIGDLTPTDERLEQAEVEGAVECAISTQVRRQTMATKQMLESCAIRRYRMRQNGTYHKIDGSAGRDGDGAVAEQMTEDCENAGS
jgi:hypothetical protein